MLRLLKKEPTAQVELSPRPQPPISPQYKAELLCCMREIERELSRNESLFNLVAEEDLVCACILERKALEHRYQYYYKLARLHGIACPISHLARSCPL